MNKRLKKLQADYQAGRITKRQYEAGVAELLENEEIDQDAHDKALEFEPEDDEDKAIYSQADVDRIVMKKARQLVRKQLREAGVDLTDVADRDLMTTLAERLKAGDGKEGSKTDDKELAALRKKAERADKLEAANKQLTVENAVLKAAGKYNPVNPAQVVRALQADYDDLLDYDDEGNLDKKSVEAAIKRVAKLEPNLFQTKKAAADEGDDLDDDNDDSQDDLDDDNDDQGSQNRQTFKGKTPGGTGTASKKGAAKQAQLKAQALEMLGIKKDNK